MLGGSFVSKADRNILLVVFMTITTVSSNLSYLSTVMILCGSSDCKKLGVFRVGGISFKDQRKQLRNRRGSHFDIVLLVTFYTQHWIHSEYSL